MNETAIISRLETRLERMERMLKSLMSEKKKTTWLGAADVMRLTGWNKDTMYRMRKTRAIEFKKAGKSIAYRLESIPEIFIKQTA